jgi:hypothetical protein
MEYTITIKIDTSNDAFEADESEFGRVLAETVDKIANGSTEGACRDSNGNKVGTFAVVTDA